MTDICMAGLIRFDSRMVSIADAIRLRCPYLYDDNPSTMTGVVYYPV